MRALKGVLFGRSANGVAPSSDRVGVPCAWSRTVETRVSAAESAGVPLVEEDDSRRLGRASGVGVFNARSDCGAS